VPNEFATALAGALGWTASPAADHPQIYAIPSTTLGALAAQVRATLGVRGGLRLIGTPGMRSGASSSARARPTWPRRSKHLPQADVILSGEPREWEAVEYVFDTAAAGQPRGMIARRPPGVRRAGHARMRGVAAHDRHRSAGGSHRRQRSLLAAHLR
jgi:hypothetical protein